MPVQFFIVLFFLFGVASVSLCPYIPSAEFLFGTFKKKIADARVLENICT